MTYSTLLYDIDDGILRLTLHRSEKMNAFTVAMCDELVDAYGRASADDAVRAIVVTGAGKAFCAGMDLSMEGNVFGLDESLPLPTIDDMRERFDAPEIASGVRDTGGKVALAMYDCLKPIVGAVNGVAVGIGSTMLLPMDFRLASTEARFGFIFGRLGITLEACSSWFLPRIVGIEQALLWCYCADIFGADEALDAGLVRSLHEPGRLVEDAVTFARSLVHERSAVGIALTRQMLLRNHAAPHPVEAHRVESLAIFHAQHGDGAEGVRAFREKRSPVFQSCASTMPSFYPWDRT